MEHKKEAHCYTYQTADSKQGKIGFDKRRFSSLSLTIASCLLLMPSLGWSAPEVPDLPPLLPSLTEASFELEVNSAYETEDDLAVKAALAVPTEELIIVTTPANSSNTEWEGVIIDPSAPGTIEQDTHCRKVGGVVGLDSDTESLDSDSFEDCKLFTN